jgi:hypothetical protein
MGITVDKDGTVTAQGEQVKNNHRRKDFGDDASAALKPASEIVDKYRYLTGSATRRN